MREVSAFLDEQENNRVLIDGKVQPLQYTYQQPISTKPQDLFWGENNKWKE